MWKRITRGSVLAIMGLLAATTGAVPTGAEVISTPTTSWGVSGLQTGTQTDSINTPVFALEQIGNVLYVGGRFTTVTNGQTNHSQASIAAFNATTGDWINTFTPNLDGAVYALKASNNGSRLFVGGDFTTVNGTSTGALVALNPSTGAIDNSWTGRVGGYQLVRDLDVDASFVYAGGGFTSIASASGSTTAFRTARFSLSNGTHDSSWKPIVVGGSVWGLDAVSGSGRVYLAGTFDSINGTARPGGFGLVNINTAANLPGTLTPNTQNVSQQFAYDVIEADDTVFVAGSQHYLQVLDKTTLALERFHRSRYRGDFQTVERIGSRVYAGSHSYQGTTLQSATGVLWVGGPPPGQSDAPLTATAPHSWVAGFDAATGVHQQSFYANLATTGGGVWAIHAANNDCVWFGGAITGAAGTPQFGISRLCDASVHDNERPTVPSRPQISDLRAGEVDLTWTPSTDNFAVAGYRLYNQSNNTLVADLPNNNSTTLTLANGSYEMYLRAYDTSGNVSWRTGPTAFTITSIMDTQRPTVPSRPQISDLRAGEVDLTWTPSTDNFAVAGYRLYNQSNNTLVADLPNNNSATLTLANGSYEMYLRAYDTSGNVSWRTGPTAFTITSIMDTQRPTPPTGLTGNASGSTITMWWGASTDNVAVAGYHLYDAGTNQIIGTGTGRWTQLTNQPAGTHQFYVKSFDAAGNTSWRSNILTFTL